MGGLKIRNKTLILLILISIVFISACTNAGFDSSSVLELSNEDEIQSDLIPNEEYKTQPKVIKEEPNIRKIEQINKFIEELNKQYEYETNLLREEIDGFSEELKLVCDDETGIRNIELCFDKIYILIDEWSVESSMLIGIKADLERELINKGFNTDLDLTNLHDELSKELSTKAQEGRIRLKDFYGELLSITSTIYEVTRVIDGDTIEINTGETIRLIGINAPEEGEKCYEESKEFLEDFLSGKEIILEEDIEDKDQYGRLLRYVFADGRHVNYGIIYLGFAHKYEYGLNTKYSSSFEEAENIAKENQDCIWKSEETNYIQDQCIYITNFNYDAIGNDNFNLNGEYVTFENECSYSINMDGWTIKDETSSHLYTIPSFTFQSGTTFTLYTGEGEDTNSALYWGRTSGDFAAIWNNNGGDTLFLRDTNGDLVLSQSY